MTQKSKAELLRRLHTGPDLLVLPNAWDALSARIIEAEGFPAVASSSAGCAAVLGYPDGQQIPRAEMCFLVKKMAGAVEVPLTADLEAGYDDVAQTALGLMEAGAAGLNFEDMVGDTLLGIDEQVERIYTLRRMGEEAGIPIVINARTDIYLAEHGDASTRFKRSVERLNRFREAGADCLFIPGVTDVETIREFVREVQGPLNILATPASPSLARLRDLGVARVSLGSGTSRVAMGALRRFAHDLRVHGKLNGLATEAIPYGEVQALLRRSS